MPEVRYIQPDRRQHPRELYQRLQSLAEQTGRPATFYVREALLEYLDDLEDIYLAERVLKKLRQGEEETYPIEEVERHLGLAD